MAHQCIASIQVRRAKELCQATCCHPTTSNSFSKNAVKVKVANAIQHCQKALMLMQAQQGLFEQQAIPVSPQGPAVGDTTTSQADEAHSAALMQEVSEALQQVHNQNAALSASSGEIVLCTLSENQIECCPASQWKPVSVEVIWSMLNFVNLRISNHALGFCAACVTKDCRSTAHKSCGIRCKVYSVVVAMCDMMGQVLQAELAQERAEQQQGSGLLAEAAALSSQAHKWRNRAAKVLPDCNPSPHTICHATTHPNVSIRHLHKPASDMSFT